jgi:hypothetical protein
MEADDTKFPCLILLETSDRMRNAKPKFHRCLTAGCRTLNVLLSFSQFEREVTGETVKACHGSGNGKAPCAYTAARPCRRASALSWFR